MSLNENFNKSIFSRIINSLSGRIFRIIAGIVFITIGLIYSGYTLGIISLIWGFFPLSAGAFDICYISAALGGPISGNKIRRIYQY
jgi:hypothetical protein